MYKKIEIREMYNIIPLISILTIFHIYQKKLNNY
jgi:hypothetical protein